MEYPDPRTAQAISLVQEFARRTGLDLRHPPRRYLWTDAFAVCNLLGLAQRTGESRFTELALRLVDQVHHTLGRHRPDAPHQGWISGLDGPQGEAHPTLGGLRIGKALAERAPEEPFDEALEWERDGQYFHYLTQWMHALDQLSRHTGDPRYNRWARELAQRAHDAFTYTPTGGGTPRMYWKMSIDLSRPLVPSMGQQDPLDGYLTALQLRATAGELPGPAGGPDLEAATERYARMIAGAEWASPDPLGIGGLLADAYRLIQLADRTPAVDRTLPGRLLGGALRGLGYYAASGELQAPAQYRLAFRELGLAIGLEAVQRLGQMPDQAREIHAGLREPLEGLVRYVPLGEGIESFWLAPASRRTVPWSDHRDINEVMLATRLVPDGYLEPAPVHRP